MVNRCEAKKEIRLNLDVFAQVATLSSLRSLTLDRVTIRNPFAQERELASKIQDLIYSPLNFPGLQTLLVKDFKGIWSTDGINDSDDSISDQSDMSWSDNSVSDCDDWDADYRKGKGHFRTPSEEYPRNSSSVHFLSLRKVRFRTFRNWISIHARNRLKL